MTTKFNPAALVADVCAELGSDFKVIRSQDIGNPSDKYGCTTFVVQSPSVLGIANLFMRVEGFTGVVESSVTWPMDHNRRQVSTSTYVSQEKADSLEGWPKTIGANIATRGPAAIAKDIQKRLIPKIVPLEPLVKAGMAAELKRETDARLNHALILKALGYSPEFIEQRAPQSGDNKPQFPLQASTKQGANHSAEFKVNDFGTTSVTLHGLSVDKVQAIIKALNLKG